MLFFDSLLCKVNFGERKFPQYALSLWPQSISWVIWVMSYLCMRLHTEHCGPVTKAVHSPHTVFLSTDSSSFWTHAELVEEQSEWKNSGARWSLWPAWALTRTQWVEDGMSQPTTAASLFSTATTHTSIRACKLKFTCYCILACRDLQCVI